ncbi:hypothetical protein GLE_2215 [Lysobacter enzymogenes]|uniref:Uncharacterized protein n=1 Tax=Lysobacter enzymogenes TaxID=69 RepID=A0A0S2DG53_LYSEN|nr:hypothetical protein GLE_2215 [Lysobacter enzymogenes]
MRADALGDGRPACLLRARESCVCQDCACEGCVREGCAGADRIGEDRACKARVRERRAGDAGVWLRADRVGRR